MHKEKQNETIQPSPTTFTLHNISQMLNHTSSTTQKTKNKFLYNTNAYTLHYTVIFFNEKLSSKNFKISFLSPQPSKIQLYGHIAIYFFFPKISLILHALLTEKEEVLLERRQLQHRSLNL